MNTTPLSFQDMTNTVTRVAITAFITGMLSLSSAARGTAPGVSPIRQGFSAEGLVQQVCDLIYQGQFLRAERLIQASPATLTESARVHALAGPRICL